MKIVALLVLSYNAFGQASERNVVWLPGFSGEVDQWNIYAPYYENERLIRSHTMGFGLGGLNQVTDNIRSAVEDELGGESKEDKNICVGYSTGGVIARNTERLYDGDEQNFGGVITLHCPNQGTKMADNFADGTVEEIISAYLDKLLEPVRKDPLLTITEVILAFPFLAPEISLGQFVDIIEFLFAGSGDAAFEELLNIGGLSWFAKDPLKVADLTTNGQFIRDLNDFSGDGFYIDIYGSEESDLFYRLMSSMLAEPQNRSMHKITDEDLDGAIKALGGLFQANSHIRRAAAIVKDIFPLTSGAKDHSRARSWSNARDELENQAELNWLRAIGALYIERVVTKNGKRQLTPLCRSKLEFLNAQLQIAIRDPNYDHIPIMKQIAELENNPDCYFYDDVVHFRWIKKESDSFLLVEDQRLSNAHATYINEKVNHAEAINHMQTTQNFDRIWNRDANDFFNTQPR